MSDTDLIIKVKTEPKNALASVNKELDETAAKVNAAESGFVKFGLSLVSIAALAGTFNFISDATREMEDLRTQFIAFTGSADAAADQLERLTQFASASPFSLSEVAEANRTLLAFGSSSKQSINQLRQLGEVSAATGTSLKEIATIFGQIQAEGKLTGERFNQLVERGVNIGPAIAKSLGVASTSIRSLISDGKVTSEEVAKAFDKMTEQGGQFFGSTERLSKTVSGSLSSLSDNVKILAATVGNSAVPAFTSFVNLLSRAVEGNIAYLKEQEKIANENEVQKRIRAIGIEVEDLDDKLKSLRKQQSEGFKFFGDDQLKVASDIDALSTSISKLSLERLKLVKQEGISEALKKDAEAAQEAQRAADKLAEKALAKKLEADEKIKEAEKKASDDQAAKFLEAERNLSVLSEKATSARLETQRVLEANANEVRLEDARKAADARRMIEEQITVLYSDQQQIAMQKESEQNEQRRKMLLESATARETEINTAILELRAQRSELLLQYDEAESLRAEAQSQKIIDQQKKTEADRLTVLRKAQKDEFDLEKQTTIAKTKFDEETYAQRVATAQTGLNALAALTRSKNREAFEIGKAAATAQALIAIPVTAIEAYKSLAGIPLVGPALGIAAAAAATVAGYENLRNIQNTKIAFAEGGVVPGTGNKDTVPALLTPGEVVVPKKNFADLQDQFIRGAVNDDQVQLLIAGNQITGKILDTLTIGVVNEKLTQIVSLLDSIRTSSGGDSAPVVITLPPGELPPSGSGRNQTPLEKRENTRA